MVTISRVISCIDCQVLKFNTTNTHAQEENFQINCSSTKLEMSLFEIQLTAMFVSVCSTVPENVTQFVGTLHVAPP